MSQVKSCLRGVLFLLIFLESLGCSPTPDSMALQEANLQGDQAIRNGYTDDETTSVFGIVSLQGRGIGTCTGTLIAPNVILTARHCVAPTWNQVNGGVDCRHTSFGPNYDADELYVTNKVQLSRNPADYWAVQEVISPADTSFCGNDVALIILAEAIDPSDAIPMTPRVDTQINDGEEYYAIGYGATNDAGSGSGLRRRRDNLTIECVAADCPSYYSRDTEWIGDTGVCQGDSGGPAVDMENRVIGIASRGSYGCDTPIYGYVFGWSDWIKSETKLASRNAEIASPDWSVGWPTDPAFSYSIGGICSEDTDCPSGLCTAEGYCTRLCNADAPCPGNYSCNGQCILDTPEEVDEENILGCTSIPASPTALFLFGVFLLFRSQRRRTSLK